MLQPVGRAVRRGHDHIRPTRRPSSRRAPPPRFLRPPTTSRRPPLISAGETSIERPPPSSHFPSRRKSRRLRSGRPPLTNHRAACWSVQWAQRELFFFFFLRSPLSTEAACSRERVAESRSSPSSGFFANDHARRKPRTLNIHGRPSLPTGFSAREYVASRPDLSNAGLSRAIARNGRALCHTRHSSVAPITPARARPRPLFIIGWLTASFNRLCPFARPRCVAAQGTAFPPPTNKALSTRPPGGGSPGRRAGGSAPSMVGPPISEATLRLWRRPPASSYSANGLCALFAPNNLTWAWRRIRPNRVGPPGRACLVPCFRRGSSWPVFACLLNFLRGLRSLTPLPRWWIRPPSAKPRDEDHRPTGQPPIPSIPKRISTRPARRSCRRRHRRDPSGH